MPGEDIVIEREPTSGPRARQLGEAAISKHLEVRNGRKDLHGAIHHAFKAAGRRLQDYARQRRQVKHHQYHSVAKVDRLFPEKGYGFLLAPEAREIYFHRGSVRNRGSIASKLEPL
jgi:hypothetical protein